MILLHDCTLASSSVGYAVPSDVELKQTRGHWLLCIVQLVVCQPALNTLWQEAIKQARHGLYWHMAFKGKTFCSSASNGHTMHSSGYTMAGAGAASKIKYEGSNKDLDRCESTEHYCRPDMSHD